MKIKCLYIRTETDEELKLDDVYCITIGALPISNMPKDYAWEQDANPFINIRSSKGNMCFKLSEIVDLDFCIVDEERQYCIPIHSLEKSKWEEGNGEI